MRQFTHIDAHSVGEVLALLDRYGEKAQVNAGGTDLMTVLKGDICPVYPEAIINLKRFADLIQLGIPKAYSALEQWQIWRTLHLMHRCVV